MKDKKDELKNLKVEQIDAKVKLEKPSFDVDDEKIKEKFLKKFLEDKDNGSN